MICTSQTGHSQDNQSGGSGNCSGINSFPWNHYTSSLSRPSVRPSLPPPFPAVQFNITQIPERKRDHWALSSCLIVSTVPKGMRHYITSCLAMTACEGYLWIARHSHTGGTVMSTQEGQVCGQISHHRWICFPCMPFHNYRKRKKNKTKKKQQHPVHIKCLKNILRLSESIWWWKNENTILQIYDLTSIHGGPWKQHGDTVGMCPCHQYQRFLLSNKWLRSLQTIILTYIMKTNTQPLLFYLTNK